MIRLMKTLKLWAALNSSHATCDLPHPCIFWSFWGVFTVAATSVRMKSRIYLMMDSLKPPRRPRLLLRTLPRPLYVSCTICGVENFFKIWLKDSMYSATYSAISLSNRVRRDVGTSVKSIALATYRYGRCVTSTASVKRTVIRMI